MNLRLEFDHERWDIYKTAVKFVVFVHELEPQIKGSGALMNQLRRAATSVVLNIAEGSGEFVKTEKCRFYRMARRSATECAAALDLCKETGMIGPEQYEEGREMMLRVVAMSVRLAMGVDPKMSGTGSGTGTGLGYYRGRRRRSAS